MPGRKPRGGAGTDQRSGGQRGGKGRKKGSGGMTRLLLRLCLLVAIGGGVYMAWRVPVGGRTAAQHARLWWQQHGWHSAPPSDERAASRLTVAQPGDEPAPAIETAPVAEEERADAPMAPKRTAANEEEAAPTQARTARREPRATAPQERITDEDRKTIERLLR